MQHPIPAKSKFCSNCGCEWTCSSWPRTCWRCGTTTWRNTRPVIVVLLTTVEPNTGVEHVLLGVRAILPALGMPALFSGFMEDSGDVHGTDGWKQDAIREVSEETSGLINLQPDDIYPLLSFPFASSPSVSGIFMAFCVAEIPWPDLATFIPNRETSALHLVPTDVVGNRVRLAFSTHEEAVEQWQAMSPGPDAPTT